MIAWLEFAGAILFFLFVFVHLWDDAADWYDQQQHELVLDELWDEDDLAESA